MPKVTPILTNFTAGEFSPFLDGRIDIAKYYNSAKTLENFVILPAGGIKRRPGTYYVAEVKDSSRKTRIIPFQFSTTQAYIVEFGDIYLRFYRNRGQLLSGAAAYEISSPYLEAHLFDLQFAQDADTMFITHPSYKTRKLDRNALTWDSSVKLMLHCDGTDGSTTFTDSATAKVVTANGNAQIDTAQYKFGGASGLFDGTGDYLSLADSTDWDLGSGDFTIEARIKQNSGGAIQMICGMADAAGVEDYSLRLDADGTVRGTFFDSLGNTYYGLAGTITNTNWHHIAFVRSGNNIFSFLDGNKGSSTDITGLTCKDVQINFAIARHGGYNGYYFNGWIDEFRFSKGKAWYTADFTPETSAYAADITTFTLSSYAPTADPFGADGSGNCPSCVSIHEQRICFANSNNNPQKIWASVSGDYEDMTTGTGNSAAFVYTIGTEQVNAIRWLSSGRALGLGTFGGVFSLGSGNDELAITPSNVVVKRETTYGALGLVPKKIGNMVYYLQRNAKTIREFGYNYDIGSYASNDINILADHITGDEIVDMDYQQSPYNILWCVRSDGVIATLTRQIDQEVLAWSRQITDGSFESVAVIPGDGGDDEVWFVVKRTINGLTKRYVEYLKPFDFGDEQEDAFFVDCGLSLDTPKTITAITKANPGVVTAESHGFSNGNIVIIRGVTGMTEVNKQKYKIANKTTHTFELTDASTGVNIDTSAYTAYISGGEVRKCVTSVSGLSHLAAETVDVCIDGIKGVASAVSGGAITITTPANGGGEIHAGLNYVSTLKTMRLEAGSAQGTAQSKLKRINKTFAMLVDSLGMNIGNDNKLDVVSFSGDTLYSGWKDITFPSLWDRDGYVKITQGDPLPLIILAIVIYLAVNED